MLSRRPLEGLAYHHPPLARLARGVDTHGRRAPKDPAFWARANGSSRRRRVEQSVWFKSVAGFARGYLRFAVFFFLLIPALAFAAPPSTVGRTMQDALDRTVRLPEKPLRIVSLAPSVTETLFALGLKDRIVGVTDFCTVPPEAKMKPHVGGAIPNLEAIAALRPDLAIGIVTAQSSALAKRLERLNIPILFVQSRTLSDVCDSFERIGLATGAVREAADLRRSMEKDLASLRARTASLHQRKVLYLVNLDPPLAVGGKSYLNDLLSAAGAVNITGDLAGDYPRISDESIIARNPEVILISTEEAEALPAIRESIRKRWPMLRAVKNDAIFSVNRDLANRPGPRLAEAAAMIARRLHPEIAETPR